MIVYDIVEKCGVDWYGWYVYGEMKYFLDVDLFGIVVDKKIFYGYL